MADVRNGLSSADQLKIDVSGPLGPAFRTLKKIDYPVVLDVGAGPCRDIANMHQLLNGQGTFIAVDYDLQRAFDAVQAHEGLVEICQNEKGIAGITDQLKIAYLVNDVLKLDLPNDMKANFILSLALTMFVPEDDLEAYAQSLVENAESGAHIFHIHSTERPTPEDPSKPQYPNGYHIHSVDKLTKIFEAQGCKVKQLAAVEDQAGRGFDWYRLDIVTP